jgi:hypothetical protein
MKKIYAATCSAFFSIVFCNAQTIINQQYASSVIAVSSEFNPTPGSSYNSTQLLGAPDVYPSCGDNGHAWVPATPNGQREFFVVGFATPQQVNTIRIYQNYGPGAVDTVYLRDAVTGIFNQVYQVTATDGAGCPGLPQMLLEIHIPTTSYNVDAMRVAINSPANANVNEFDAVAIANFSRMNFEWTQSATSVISFSSQYTTTNWSAQKALGPPNVYPNCGDNSEAWASAGADNTREFLELGYTFQAHVNRVTIYQTVAPGAVDTVYLRDASTHNWIKVFDRTATVDGCGYSNALEINFTETNYNVDAIRIAINSPAVPYWNEIDAVTIQSNLPPNSKFSTQSGNWSDNNTWTGGVVPGPGDSVMIGSGHIIQLDVNGVAKSLVIGSGGALNANAGNQLTIGPNGGGKEILQVLGALNLSNGAINLNGHAEFAALSSFNMSGGEFRVDGNDGTDAGSVADGISMINFQTGMSLFSATGGTITIVDPQYHANGQALSGNYTFTGNSVVKFGNGVSTTGGNNPFGFGGTAIFPTLNNFTIDAVNGLNNRQFKMGYVLTVAGNTMITSGVLQPYSDFVTNNDIVNNGTILLDGSLRAFNDLTNNGNIVMGTTPANLVVGHDLINIGFYNVTTTYTLVGNNVVNNGTLNTFWLYFANNATPSGNAQTIGGSGTFNIYGIDLLNSNVNGVTVLLPLHLEQLFINQGKLFLGDNDLTVNQSVNASPGSSNYVVINGNGKLIVNNITTNSTVFSIGTNNSYTPVTIVNGGGHNFSASVKNNIVSNPPALSSVVHREWNITDLTGGAVSADITFQWNAADEDPTFDRNLCYVSHFSGGAWHGVTTPGAASGSDPYKRTATGVSSFSPFALGSNGALPVHLMTFGVTKDGKNVKIIWTTSDEINLTGYEVERSTDGIEFSKIIRVNAHRLETEQTYETTDANPLAGRSYYRLKMINDDGTFSYSKVVKIEMDRAITTFIFPNPARRIIHVQGAQQFRAIQLMDESGRVLKEWQKPSSDELDIGVVASGIYHLRMFSGNDIITERLVISR